MLPRLVCGHTDAMRGANRSSPAHCAILNTSQSLTSSVLLLRSYGTVLYWYLYGSWHRIFPGALAKQGAAFGHVADFWGNHLHLLAIIVLGRTSKSCRRGRIYEIFILVWQQKWMPVEHKWGILIRLRVRQIQGTRLGELEARSKKMLVRRFIPV